MIVKRMNDELHWAVLLLSAAACGATALHARLVAGDEAPMVIKNVVPRPVAAPAHSQLDQLLWRKIAYVDGICGLSDDQKKKLQLAGQGDIKRFMDRIDDLRAQSQSQPGGVRFDDLARENESLKHLLIAGPFEKSSLFGKTEQRLLTREQQAKLEADRIISSSAWIADFSEARDLSRKYNRPMVVHFHADWAAPCCLMKEVLYRPKVVRFAHDHFIPVFIDVDRDDGRQVMREYGINSVPSDLLLSPEGVIAGRSLGTKTEQAVIDMLQSVTGPVRQPASKAGTASSPEGATNPR